MAAQARVSLGRLVLGEGHPVAIMGVLNVSPESFHAGSVHVTRDDLVRAGLDMVEAGADILDVGARSTAPYREIGIDDDEEERRLTWAVEALAGKVTVPISADTTRPRVARSALEAGARVVNDQSGLVDPELAEIIAAARVGVILMAAPGAATGDADPVAAVRVRMELAQARAWEVGIGADRIVLDPGIGFFRAGAVPWHTWDVTVLGGLPRLKDLGQPLAVGVSRKSFLGEITGHGAPEARLAASLAATAAAVLHGVDLVRTHDVAPTVDAVRVAERIRQAQRP
jgi:dihydropteroate synthase